MRISKLTMMGVISLLTIGMSENALAKRDSWGTCMDKWGNVVSQADDGSCPEGVKPVNLVDYNEPWYIATIITQSNERVAAINARARANGGPSTVIGINNDATNTNSSNSYSNANSHSESNSEANAELTAEQRAIINNVNSNMNFNRHR